MLMTYQFQLEIGKVFGKKKGTVEVPPFGIFDFVSWENTLEFLEVKFYLLTSDQKKVLCNPHSY